MHRNGILKRICLALFIFQYDLFLICLFVYFFFHFSLYIITPLFLRYDSQRVDHQIVVNSFSMIFAWALSCHHLYLSTHKHNFCWHSLLLVYSCIIFSSVILTRVHRCLWLLFNNLDLCTFFNSLVITVYSTLEYLHLLLCIIFELWLLSSTPRLALSRWLLGTLVDLSYARLRSGNTFLSVGRFCCAPLMVVVCFRQPSFTLVDSSSFWRIAMKLSKTPKISKMSFYLVFNRAFSIQSVSKMA